LWLDGLSSAKGSLVVARTGSENVNAAPMILDRNPKPDSAAAAAVSIAQTDTMTTMTMTKEKPNSLMTDHFEKLVGNDRDDDKSQDKRDGVFAECEQRLEQKQQALEKLFESKQEGLKALASDIEMQQQDLKKLASDIETKMRGFDDRVQEETTGALARLNAAANDGVDKINRGR
jgi:septal ring factor EnvC (AmiA/AmiB activator)